MNRWWIKPLLKGSIRRSLRRSLAGVWVSGPIPPAGAVLAPNHHSWWDGYLLAEIAWQLGQPLRLMMTRRQLERFPFLRLLGAVDEGQLRPLVRAAQSEAWVVIFPEGAIRPQGPVGAVQPGAAWLAQVAGVPLIPLAVRVVLRGAQHPEAFIRVGTACPGHLLGDNLNAVLARLDTDLTGSDPDFPPPGYLRWLRGQGSVHDEVPLASRLLAGLSRLERE